LTILAYLLVRVLTRLRARQCAEASLRNLG
jgi:hypothetical protein